VALPVHSGTAAIDLNNSGTYRQDISEILLVSLTPQNNFIGSLQVGAEFAGPQLYWTEDALNQYKITGDTAASMLSTVTTMAVSQADAAVLKTGYLLTQDTLVGSAAAEVMQITAISATTITLTRAFAGTAVTYTTNTIFRVVAAPINPNSDLGPDLSRQRLSKTNFIYRSRKDINIDSEAIIRSKAGYVPGIQDELGYQYQQRLAEMLRDMNNVALYSYPQASGNPTNDFQTMYGMVAALDGTFNSTATQKRTTAEAFNDTVLNAMITDIKKQGGVSKAIAVGDRLGQILGALYSDTIRREQSDRVRGFWMNVFDPAMANPHELVVDSFVNDTAATAIAIVYDPDRVFIRPQLGQFLYNIEAPSFRDGDALSILSKWSLEPRNTGTDVGYAHELHTAIL
jgi:hypothetical protein